MARGATAEGSVDDSAEGRSRDGGGSRSWVRVLAWGWVVLGAGMCVWRGLLPALSAGWSRDLLVIYGGVRAWARGLDPYGAASALSALRAGGGDWPMAVERYLILYPPSMMVLLSPVGWLDFRSAVWAVWLGNVVSLGAILWGLLRLTGLRWRSAAGLGLMGFVLAMAPTHTSFRMGQVTLPAVALVVWALVLESRGRGVLAGVLLGVATGLKPQMAGLFVLWLVYRKCWWGVAAAVATPVALLAIGAVRIELAGADWWNGWRDNVAVFTQGGKGDPRPGVNDSAYQLINLESAVHAAGSFALGPVRLGVWALLASLGVWMWWCAARVRGQELVQEKANGVAEAGSEARLRLLVAGALGLVSLLAVYHRAYDGVLAVLAAAWAVSAVAAVKRESVSLSSSTSQGLERNVGWGVLAMLAALLVPWGPVAHAVVGPRLPGGWSGSWVWRAVVTPMQAWGMLGALGLLAWAMWRRSRRSVGAPG